jgi:UDP-N-acetylglucosamine 4-epimerase
VDELFAANFSSLYGIETIGLRYFNVFGHRQDPNGAYAAVIPKFVSALIKHESPAINGDGSYSRDFTYIENVIQANQLAAITPSDVIRENQKIYYKKNGLPVPSGIISEIFNVAFGERTSLNELAILIKQYLTDFDSEISNIKFRYGKAREGDVPHSLASIEKGKVIIGYAPQYSVQKGLKEACGWYWNCLR